MGKSRWRKWEHRSRLSRRQWNCKGEFSMFQVMIFFSASFPLFCFASHIALSIVYVLYFLTRKRSFSPDLKGQFKDRIFFAQFFSREINYQLDHFPTNLT